MTPQYHHSVQLPEGLEQRWKAYQAQTHEPFNALVRRLLEKELDSILGEA